MTKTTLKQSRFQRRPWLVAVLAAGVVAVQVVRRQSPEPPMLALHSMPFTVSAGEVPWPDRWLMRGPPLSWFWDLRSKLWPENPSGGLDYALWELGDAESLSALPFLASRTNDDWIIRTLTTDQAAMVEDKLTTVSKGWTHLRASSGEVAQATLPGSLSNELCLIEAAVRIRTAGTHVTSTLTLSSQPGPLASNQQVAVAFEAMVPEPGAVLLFSRRADPPRAVLVNATKKP